MELKKRSNFEFVPGHEEQHLGGVQSAKKSRLVAHSRIFRLFMKGKFEAYIL